MQADLRRCWSHIPHCWKYNVAAHIIISRKLKVLGFRGYIRIISSSNYREVDINIYNVLPKNDYYHFFLHEILVVLGM